jgi:hypothetical protein
MGGARAKLLSKIPFSSGEYSLEFKKKDFAHNYLFS